MKNKTKGTEIEINQADKVVDYIIMEGLSSRATDIHLEIFESKTRLRYRVDGALKEVEAPSTELYKDVISELKNRANLDRSKTGVPQSGRFEMSFKGRRFVVMLSVLPSHFGEKVTMRLIDADAVLLKLEQIDFSPANYKIFKELIAAPYGLLVITGPMGSGKTTTLYATLASMDSVSNNIMTVEDPVEYTFHGVSQAEVDDSKNFTYPVALMSVLKNDPDVVMVGELKDRETTDVVIKTVLSGHLVLTCMGASDAAGVFSRFLEDFKLEPYKLNAAVIGVLGQRLVRKVCHKCRENYKPADSVFKFFGKDPNKFEAVFQRGRGCEECGNTGFRGRTTIHDLIVPSKEIKEAVSKKAPAETIKKIAAESGMSLMKEDGWQKALLGKTTLEEVMKVTKD